MFLSIFDQTLTAHFLKTDDARANRFLLLKQLTLEVHDDTISDDNAPSSGSSELIKFKFQTLSIKVSTYQCISLFLTLSEEKFKAGIMIRYFKT